MARQRFAFAVALASGILFGLPIARAQPAERVHRIAFLGTTSPSDYASQIEAFRGGLRDLGYVEGRNLVIDFRWADGKYERLAGLAGELVRSKPDVLVTHGPPGARFPSCSG
jgi:putative tryptophan/tyrosine transport system substrate-binding protein